MPVILPSVLLLKAVKRLVERNHLTEKEVQQRLSSQISNEERVSHADVVLCTFWAPEVTQKQVKRNCISPIVMIQQSVMPSEHSAAVSRGEEEHYLMQNPEREGDMVITF